MKFLRALLLVAMVLVVVWVCVVFWWQVAEVEPTGRQMLVWLGLLPLTLLAAWWLVRALLRRRRMQRQPDAPGVAAAPAVGVEPEHQQGASYRLDVFAHAVHLPVAGDSATALDALAEGASPGLHPGLRDHAGLPIFAAWVHVLDAEPWRSRFAAEATVSDEQARALALLEPVADALFADLAALLPPPDVVEHKVVAGLRRMEHAGLSSRVRIRLLLSQAWPPALRQAVGDWLLAKAGADGLASVAMTDVEVTAVAGPTQAWRTLSAIGRAADGAGDWHVVLGCDSLLGERSVDALQAAGLLVGNRRPEGVIPGEGAAGLVLRHAAIALAANDADIPAASMHTLAHSAAVPGGQSRAVARGSADLMLRALALCQAEPGQVCAVISDADHRPSRALESASATALAFPDLEPAEQHLALGAACGHLGHVAPLALLAVASAKVQREAASVVVLGVGATDARTAVTLSVPGPPSRDGDVTPATST